MTSLDYSKEIGVNHWNLMRKINNYVKYLKDSSINVNEYFIESSYKEDNGVTYNMYEISKKGLILLESKVYCSNAINYCVKHIENYLLPTWVYRNLERFGNCSIGIDTFNKHGKDKILKNLKEKGFDCDLRVVHKDVIEKNFLDTKRDVMDFCILDLKKDKGEEYENK